MLPVGEIHAGLIGRVDTARPRLHQGRTEVVRTGFARAPRGVEGVGIDDNVVEPIAGDEIQGLVNRGDPRLVHVQRPEPVVFVALQKEAGAVGENKMVRMFPVHAQHPVNFGVRVLHTSERNRHTVEFRQFGFRGERPLPLCGRRDANFPGALSIEKSRHREGLAVGPGHGGGEGNHERIRRLSRGGETEIVRLPAGNGRCVGRCGRQAERENRDCAE